MARKKRKPSEKAAKPKPAATVQEVPEDPWWAYVDRGALVLLGSFIVFWSAFSVLDVFNPREQGIIGVDPVSYYAWLRSPLYDHDFQFANDFRTLNPAALHSHSLVNPDGERTATGHLPNYFAVGSAILWSPFVLVAHLEAGMLDLPRDGFSRPYHAAIFYANMLYGLFGLMLTYYAVRTWYRPALSAMAALGAFACTPVLHFAFGQFAMAHACSFFTMALMLLLWARLRERDGYWPWIVIGLALGLASLVRWQNCMYGLIFAVDLMWFQRRKNLPRLMVCALACVVMFLPQMLAWKIVFGSFLTIPQGGEFMQWTHPHFVRVLFSASEGLFTWTPWCLLAATGLFIWPARRSRVYAAIALAFVVQVYIAAAAGDAGWTFGARRLVNATPLLAFGFAALAQRISTRNAAPAIATALLLSWNFLFVLQYGGILDPYYINEAIVELQETYSPADLQSAQATGLLPNGEPLNLGAYIEARQFPRGGGPSFRQFVLDKPRVIVAIFDKLAGKGPTLRP